MRIDDSTTLYIKGETMKLESGVGGTEMTNKQVCPTCHQPLHNSTQTDQIREYYIQLSYDKKLTKVQKYDKIQNELKIPRSSIRRAVNTMIDVL